MADSIGTMSDNELLAMAKALSLKVAAEPTDYGLTLAFSTELTGAVGAFGTDLGVHADKQTEAKAARVQKDSSRSVLEAVLRDAKLGAQAAKIPENVYVQMGFPTSNNTAPPSATVPAVSVNTSERLRHTLNWTDAATLDNKKKPRGAMGAEIWVKIDGPPPGNETDCVFLTLDAFTPYMKEYTPAEAGKTAHYMVRWRMRDGSVSAWGETVSATITG
jgi:hypothetical protein